MCAILYIYIYIFQHYTNMVLYIIVTYQHLSLADSTEKGWVDVDLSEKGLGEAKGAGELLKAAPW